MAGDPDTISPELERLLVRSAEAVRRLGRRHGLSEADLDQVFQDVRIRLWKALESGEKIAAVPASYVYRTAASAALDLIRRRRARPEETYDLSQTSSEAAFGAAPNLGDPVEVTELEDVVSRAVDALVESRRPVVRMYLAGYKLEEIADLLGWTEAKSRNLLYRGLADLRERLTGQGIGPEVAP